MSSRPQSTAGSDDAGRREPQLLRFGLRQLFLFVSAAAILCAVAASTGGPWPWLVGFLASLVAAHVTGNFLGTRLRDSSAEVQRWKAANSPLGADVPAATPEPVRWSELGLPEQTPLGLFQPAPPRRVHGATVAGAIAGGAVGIVALAYVSGEQTTWPGLVVGALSCGVMGAWLAMLVSSFWMIARHAWKHALGKR